MNPKLKKFLILGGVVLLISGGLLAWRLGLVPQIGNFFAAETENIAITGSYIPPPSVVALAAQMKNRGCIFGSLLGSEPHFIASDFERSIELLGRSDCAYIHRALETWISPPDFSKVRDRIRRIKAATGKDYIYEIMIAEALSVNATYFYPVENRNFRFKDMCHETSMGAWGPNTCTPSFYKEEYRKYFRYVTQEAINNGIKSIMIGEIVHSDNLWWQEPTPPEFSAPIMVKEIRDYAASKGATVVVVAQAAGSSLIPGESRSSAYVKHFDFILGPLMLIAGRFDECLDSNSPDCRWADQWRIYSPDFRNMAHNVLVMMDWATAIDDDPKVFARMTSEERADVLYNVYTKLKERNIGFIMPFVVLMGEPQTGTECYGPNTWTYSADKTYTHVRACRDEDAIKSAFQGIRWTPTPLPTSVPGDANGDGTVNILDFNMVISHFGESGTNTPGDVNHDGTVNILDFNMVISHFGE